VKCMKTDLFNCLHFYNFPPDAGNPSVPPISWSGPSGRYADGPGP
jgi:hypothetical protein